MNTKIDIPRSSRSDLWEPAETAIFNAMQEVEKMPPDPILTDAVCNLSKAKDLVSAYIDDQIQRRNILLRKAIDDWCFIHAGENSLMCADEMYNSALEVFLNYKR